MAKYELVVIYDPFLEEQEQTSQIEKLKEQIARRGGTLVGDLDIWGRRRLAYSIQKKDEGYYVLATFESDGDAASLHELERTLRLSEAVLREQLVRVPAPKALKARQIRKKAKADEAAAARQYLPTHSAGDAGASLSD